MSDSTPKLRAFVLMPFDDDFDRVYEHLIVPSLTDNGFEVTRVDLSINQRQILKDIVNYLAEADIVIADVSGLNGNVMYELGLAHGMGRHTVMITRDIDELPFDLRSYRATAYSTEFTEAEKLKNHLVTIARAVVDGSIDFGNPVQDFAPEFLRGPDRTTLGQLKDLRDTSEENSTPAVDDGELGLLDYSIQLDQSVQDIDEISGAITSALEKIGNQMVERTQQIERTSANLGDKAAPALQILMREMARDYDVFSGVFAENNPLFGDALTRMSQSTNGLARLSNFSTDDDRKKALENIESLRSTEATYTDVYNSINTFSISLGEMVPMEKSLTGAVRRAASLVNETAQYINSARSELARTRGLLEERLQED